uniref:Neutral/alkaline non-lysosomal ceramidase N-terminal domain-containing protein n=1 Tax=Schlesneria paludicola TaxID=360056 RepID=A0A7C2P1C5_9PLAN
MHCRRASGVCGIAIAVWIVLGVATASDAAGLPLRAGAFAQDVTPPRFPITVNGNMSDHFAQAAHDPLHARCLVLANDETSLAIVVVDSCMIPREIMDSAKRRAAYRTGIPASHILISATHAHSCPTVGGVFQSDPDADYQLFLADRIADGIERAAKQLEPAKIGWAVAENPHQLFNRRWKLKEGILGENPFGQKVDLVRMNPGYNNPDVTEPAGPIDPQVSVLAVQSRGGRPIAVLANYSLHYVGGVPGDVLSADYYGEFSQRIVRLIGATQTDPPCVGIMSNGTSGDVNNVNYALTAGPKRQPFEQIGIVAESVAQTAYAAYQTIQYDDAPVLAVREAEVDLGVRKPTAEDVAQARQWLADAGPGPYRDRKHIYARETVLLAEYPATVKARLQAIRVGNLGIVSSPCETFTETGLAIKSHSPLKHTFTIELANGYNGYLPTPQQHAWGGYETWRARSSYLAVDAEPRIRETLLGLLGEVAK